MFHRATFKEPSTQRLTHRRAPVTEPLEQRRLLSVVFDSEGFESPRYAPGPLEGQDPVGPWRKDTARAAVATVQTQVVEAGSQAVRMTRPAAPDGDTRYGILDLVLPDQNLDVIRISWDMNVPPNLQAGVDFGPFFGVEAYDDQSNGGIPLLIGSLGVDAKTGDVLYQDGATGVFTETGFDVLFNRWNHFVMELDYHADTYTVFVNGVARATTGFVDGPIIGFTDAPIAALAATADSRATATGAAYLDNYRIDITTGQAQPEIQQVYVTGTQWSDSFKHYLETTGVGDDVFGYRVDNLDPSAATSTLPWTNTNQIVLRYSAAPTGSGVPAPGMVLDGQRSDYAVIGVSQLGPQTYVLTLDRALGNLPGVGQDGDRVKLTVPDAGPGGSDFHLTLNPLQGDANRAGEAVTVLDLNTVKARLNRTAGDPASTPPPQYTAFADVNATGDITSLDLNAVKARLNDSLPESSAAAAAPGLFASAPIRRSANALQELLN
jgi:dockerin type I repeat protein